jgi:hypothetical protein
MVLAMVAINDGSEILAGGATGLAILIKVYPLIVVLYFVARRRWRAIGYTALTVFAGCLLSLLILGRVAWGFLHTMVFTFEPHVGVILLPKVSVPGAFVDLSALMNRAGMGSASRFIPALGVLGAIIVIGLTFEAVRRSHEHPQTLEDGFGLFVAAMVLVIPNAWPHYMVLLLLPLLQLAIAAYQERISSTAWRLGFGAYIIVEISYVIALTAWVRGDLKLASIFQEGLFISALMTFAASYLLLKNDGQIVSQSSSRATSFETQIVTTVPSNFVLTHETLS